MNKIRLRQSPHPHLIFSAVFIFAAVFITLFQHWEATHETWFYWFFARVFAQTGRFVIPDRSPVYILYLQLFRPFGFPAMVISEYAVTLFITGFALVVFLKRFIPVWLATLGVIIWLPYFQISEPSAQLLAMAFCLAAVLLREKQSSRNAIAWSYTLFVAAYLTRSNYIIILLLFIARDIFTLLKHKSLIPLRLQIQSDWPVVLSAAFLLMVYAFQSPLRWNNVWGATTTWFPSDGKSFIRMLQNYNASYIMLHYGSYQDHDFYMTNNEVFPGAHDLISAYFVNPQFMLRVAGEYAKVGIPMATNLTQLPSLFSLGDDQIIWQTVLLALIITGALLQAKSLYLKLFVLGSAGMLALTIVHMPKERYMVFLIPVFMLSAIWYGNRISELSSRILHFKRMQISRRWSQILRAVVITILFYLYSAGPSAVNFSGVFKATWPDLLRTVVSDYGNGKLRALDIRDTSVYFPPMKSSYGALNRLLPQCHGVMTEELSYIGAFTNYDYTKLYDIWEIPPFGRYGTHGDKGDGGAGYDGLRPERINCLFISKNLTYGVGMATNSQIRYENYIAPYAQFLQARGAKTFTIEGYGEAIIL